MRITRLNRSGLYYTPAEPDKAVAKLDETLMVRIDHWHTRCLILVLARLPASYKKKAFRSIVLQKYLNLLINNWHCATMQLDTCITTQEMVLMDFKEKNKATTDLSNATTESISVNKNDVDDFLSFLASEETYLDTGLGAFHTDNHGNW